MHCPMFVDNVRECLDEFFHLHKYNTTNFCQSDDYEKCLIYLAINSKCQCKYLDRCSNMYDNKFSKIFKKIFDNENVRKFLYDMLTNYCFSENCIKCAKYKLLIDGEIPPMSLRPDGKKFHISDMLLGKKIVLEQI